MPLFVVAGLPVGPAQRVIGFVKESFQKPCRVISIPTRAQDSGFYRADYIDQLLAASVSFASRRRATDVQPVTPEFIVLLYVPAADDEGLLNAFDFSAFPIALESLSLWDNRGKLLRNDEETLLRAVRDALSQKNEPWLRLLQVLERIKSRRGQDAFLLPPRNFRSGHDTALAEKFREMRRGQRPWDNRFPELVISELKSDTAVRVPEGKTLRVFQDVRELLFVPAHPSAYHGAARELDEIGRDQARDLLSTLYRFGGPMEDGFHHDVRFPDGRDVGSQGFVCSRRGKLSQKASYANVYPNDFVRFGK